MEDFLHQRVKLIKFKDKLLQNKLNFGNETYFRKFKEKILVNFEIYLNLF